MIIGGGKMLYGYDLFHLPNRDEMIKIEPTYSIVILINILEFSNLIENEIKKASKIAHALAKISHQFNHIMQDSWVHKNVPILKMRSTMFENSLILSCPLIEKEERLIIREIIEMMSDIQLYLLREGVLIRGGITIGDICHSEQFVFGKALVELHELETKKVIYPRVILSEKLLAIIKQSRDHQQYLQIDDDQFTYIDYLGGKFLDLAEVLYPDYMEDFKQDYLDKITQLIIKGKDSSLKYMYLWLEQKYQVKLNYLKDRCYILK